MLKKRDALAELLFCQSKLIAFLPFLLTSPSAFLKLPYLTFDREAVSSATDSEANPGGGGVGS